ncbi:hypothetical protein ACLIMP_11370 [Novosphingobium aerophilum]|uniref:hypothetical protein n=1 Tax=Novosphingobium TaxID=165696 RepID=UPI002D777664|nr:hypothetical protein [Novosphingobium sp. RL4]WRT91795.1 hypothetical protein U9J33_11285 [Novosphingobium sp. RL4]
MARKFLISRVALAVAMTGGMAAAVAPVAAVAKEKAPAKATFSKEYAAVAAPVDKAIADAQANPAVKAASDKAKAAQTDAEKAAARAEVDAAMGGILAQLQTAGAAAQQPIDKLKQGEMTRNVGVLMNDPALQHKGLVMMLDSGQTSPETLGQVQYLAGVTAYQSAQYDVAARYLQQSFDAGYRDQQNMIQPLLADSYKRSNNPQAALAMVQKELEAAKANGTKPNESSIRSALQASYDAKQLAPSTEYAAMLAQYYPSVASWNISISIVRQLASLQNQENIDLMRLMFATGSMKDKRDYFEYIQNVDPRAFPGEAVKVMDQGLAKGLLTQAEVGQDRANSAGRVAADKASLPAAERDALKPAATAASVTGSADVFLSYEQYAKAEELYKVALGKPGVDANKANLRLGMAQAMQGKAADAQASLAKVTGTRAPIAKLWSAYAASKATPAS